MANQDGNRFGKDLVGESRVDEDGGAGGEGNGEAGLVRGLAARCGSLSLVGVLEVGGLEEGGRSDASGDGSGEVGLVGGLEADSGSGSTLGLTVVLDPRCELSLVVDMDGSGLAVPGAMGGEFGKDGVGPVMNKVKGGGFARFGASLSNSMGGDGGKWWSCNDGWRQVCDLGAIDNVEVVEAEGEKGMSGEWRVEWGQVDARCVVDDGGGCSRMG